VKAKIVSLMLSLLLVFTLGADVSMEGNDTTGTGTQDNPWRTITHAISQSYSYDIINVGPSDSLWYGGAVPENIVVDRPLTIKSTDGAAATKIDVSGQGPGTPFNVVEIISSYVTLDGFTLTGTARGVYAHPAAPGNLDYVTVQNCIIKIDQVCEGVGILMSSVKYPTIDNNQIMVGTEGGDLALSVDSAWGIKLYDCFSATVTNNDLDVHGSWWAVGIDMDGCGKSLVDDNTVSVLGAGDVLAFGIRAYNSPLIDITNNPVTVEANGNFWAVVYGIKVISSARADIGGNTVDVAGNMVGSGGGFLKVTGIKLGYSHESSVTGNSVTVTGAGNVNASSAQDLDLSEEEQEDLADLDEILLESLGDTLSWACGSGSVIGIKVKGSDFVNVGNNVVDADLDLVIVSGDQGCAVGGGGGVAIGIAACGAYNIRLFENTVDADADLTINVAAVEATSTEYASGGGSSVALGTVLCHSSGEVSGNESQAESNLDLTVQSVPSGYYLETGSALARFNSEVVGAIHETLIETLESESIDVQLNGGVPSIESYAEGGGEAVGIGIMLIASHGTKVIGNNPVSGIGNLIATIKSLESYDYYNWADAIGGGMGLGIGIAVIDSMDVAVRDNGQDTGGSVIGTGTASVVVGAREEPAAGPYGYAYAAGGGSGIGIGILLTGCMAYLEEAEQLPEGDFWMHRPEVVNNNVYATGTANPINVSAVDLVPSHESLAYGEGFGLALGIAALWYPGILIEGNTVEADGDALVDIYSEAIHYFDPTSAGDATGVGIGIVTVFCYNTQIIGNEATGTGTADAELDAYEKVKLLYADAYGDSIGLGMGIMVFHCTDALIAGNSVAKGLGDAEIDIISTSEIPLGYAFTWGLASGVGKGIAVVCSAWADVINCNTAAGEGTARFSASANADFDYDGCLGEAVSIDIMMAMFWPPHPAPMEFGMVNYNSMVDATPLGSNSDWVMLFDAGLYKIGPELNAFFNWWNDPTGPSGPPPFYFPLGAGEPLVIEGSFVAFSPWLYVMHTMAMADQTGYFGDFVSLSKGLNTLSTPLALEEEVVPSRTWQDIVDNSGLAGKINYVDRWDPVAQAWVGVNPPVDTLDPLDAFYIYMKQPGVVFLMYNSDKEHDYSMPSRELEVPDGGGWCLISANPVFIWWEPLGMPVDEALSSIEQTPDGLPGYTQVISPIADSQPAWYYVPGMSDVPWMEGIRGYWVWMENGDILVGFGFTPIWIGPF